MEVTAVLALTQAARDIACRIVETLPGAQLHGLRGRVEAPVTFDDTALHLRALFAQGTPVVGVCAAGILIRALAPVLGDKHAEPPVLAVSADGVSVVPLLGGHHGANRLARRLADALGAHAAVTTAGDKAFGFGLDEPPPGWRVANPAAARPIMAALLAGDPVRLEVEAGDAAWLTRSAAPFADDGAWGVRVTDHGVEADANELILHPPVLAVGVGCERGCDPAELQALVADTLAEHGLSPLAVAVVASLDLKADEPAVHAVAGQMAAPARFFSAAALEAWAGQLATPSDVVFRETGCHGVAEGAALAAAGAGGQLIVAKTKSARATCAVARHPAAVDANRAGSPRGRLSIVGIGPGQDAWRTPEASRVVADAEILVGYHLYLDLLGDLARGKPRRESALGEEEARARAALDLAAEGRRVALVCSGDPGIYALATLVFELLDREARPDWNRVDIAVVPGISALQAAAARAGAPVNHDFCTISLSDLLTPWPVIEARLAAAAAGDFVVAFYNPVSKRRRDQLPRARDILLTGRPPETPVVLARNLGREGEHVEIITLAELTPDKVDMLTMVLVGNRETRRTGAWVYTPRGYAKKM